MSRQNGKPIRNVRAGAVQVRIWCNETQQDGEARIRYSIRMQKRKRKESETDEGTDRYLPDELSQLAAAVQEAFEDMVRAGSKNGEEVAT